jgi:ribosome assembly protein 1
MPVITPQKLIGLQKAPSNIRNICILAHVDHGKTSLTDALLATNGIISPKLAGKVRYLDSRPDEQLRGITMESSAISLYFSMMRRVTGNQEQGNGTPQAVMQEYLINLIDSPGHIDFQSEVSTASRLCDGAVVLVDAVEGVCSQTVTVLRQTWVEKLRPVLVINKMDRLITELKMTPLEANTHLSQLLEQVNAVMGSFFQGERMEEDLRWREKMEERVTAAAAKAQERDVPSDTASEITSSEYEERDDEDIYFAPEKNNVIFSSAIDGWAFTVKQFAALYEKKLGIKRSVLEKVLWGEFYMDPKTKRVLGPKHLKGRHLKPMFVQLVLENIWAVYNATVGGPNGKGDEALLTKILGSLGISIPAHILNSRVPHNILTTLFAKWLPLSTALLVTVVEQLPSPAKAQETRMTGLLDSSPNPEAISSKIRSSSDKFTQDKNAPVLAFVSKMVAMKESELPRNKRPSGRSMTAEEARELARKKRAEIARAQAAEGDGVNGVTALLGSVNLEEKESKQEEEKEDPEHLIGFARLYSGTLKQGDEIFVIPPKYSPAHPHNPPAVSVKVEALYMLMGRGLESLEEVPAGCIFGIEGLQEAILKQGTLCSLAEGAPNLAGIASTQTAPIVRVALEPEDPRDLEKMIEGLKMLERSDPCAVYEVLPETGEHVLGTAGELHLERCLKDLQERFARCAIQVGEPIVPYREGIINQPSLSGEMAVGPRGTADLEVTGRGGTIKIRLRAQPLPVDVMNFLTGNFSAIKKVVAEQQQHKEASVSDGTGELDGAAVAGDKETGREMTVAEFRSDFIKAFEEADDKAHGFRPESFLDRIIAFGPRRVGANVLLDSTTTDGNLAKPIFQAVSSHEKHRSVVASIGDKIVHAFQLATQQGPLCHEPTQGIAVDIQALSFSAPENEDFDITSLSPALLKSLRSAIHSSILEYSSRLYLATLLCTISSPELSLGRVYDVLAKRRSHILSEALSERTNTYVISSLLPLRESFGFADEIRKRTSGSANVEMAFRGFENLEDEDPFWVPSTEEEKEDLGDTADRENRAREMVDEVRRRKGMHVAGRKGLDAEKERNMKR